MPMIVYTVENETSDPDDYYDGGFGFALRGLYATPRAALDGIIADAHLALPEGMHATYMPETYRILAGVHIKHWRFDGGGAAVNDHTFSTDEIARDIPECNGIRAALNDITIAARKEVHGNAPTQINTVETMLAINTLFNVGKEKIYRAAFGALMSAIDAALIAWEMEIANGN